MMMRDYRDSNLLPDPQEVSRLFLDRRPFRDVLLIDFLSSYTSISSHAGRGP